VINLYIEKYYYIKNLIKNSFSFILCTATFLLGSCGQALISDEYLAKRSSSQFSEMKKSQAISRNTSDLQMVRRIGERIAKVAKVDLPGTEWEFVVFDKTEPNAFAMPGGKVGVNSGLIMLANGNEDEIAAVMGHEIAHVAFRHGNKRMSQAMGIALGGVILNTAMRDKSKSDRALAGGAYGIGSTVGVALPFSRTQEREADHRGLFYSAMAGFDPRGAVSFWKKMQSRSKRKMPQFLSTHPNPGNRIQFLQSNMNRALDLYRQAKFARGEKPNP
jgi:predicted Zn-dependent protease